MYFPGGSVVKNPPASEGDRSSTLGQEEPLRKETATHSSTLAWEILWTEETGGLQSMGYKESDMTYQLNSNNRTAVCLSIFALLTLSPRKEAS